MARTTRELTDAQWAKLAPLLPPQRPRMGRPPKDHRLIVEAIVWLDRTAAPWRDLPSQFGPWETVASRFYRWRRQGIWDRVLAALQADTDARGRPGHGGLWSILTSRAIGIGRRWAAAAAPPPSCTFGR
jgi:transposase